jgi:hypothetical protein
MGDGVGDADLVGVGSGIGARGDFHSPAEVFSVLDGAKIGFLVMMGHPVDDDIHFDGLEFVHGPIGVDEIRHLVLFGVFVDIMAYRRIHPETASVDELDILDIGLGIGDGDGTRFDAFQGPQEIIARPALGQVDVGNQGLKIDAVDQVIDRAVSAAVKNVGDGGIHLQKIVQIFDFQGRTKIKRNVILLEELDDFMGGFFGFGIIREGIVNDQKQKYHLLGRILLSEKILYSSKLILYHTMMKIHRIHQKTTNDSGLRLGNR